MAIASASSSVVEPHQREHRSEHLDLAELAGRVDVAEDGRLDVEAVGQGPAGGPAAERAAWPVPSAWARSIMARIRSWAARLTTGPMPVVGSNGSPRVMSRVKATTFSASSS